jgi:hypothetical protein
VSSKNRLVTGNEDVHTVTVLVERKSGTIPMKKFYTTTIVVAALLILIVSVALLPPRKDSAPPQPLTPDEIACYDFLKREMPLFTDYIGDKHPSEVTMVEFQYNYRVTGAEFSVLKALPNLEELNCHKAHSLNDSFADCLQYLPKLKTLNLTGTLVTPKSLAEIAKLEQLESLRIIRHFREVEDTTRWGPDDTFTDESLEILSECSQLKHLYIGEPCNISDAGLGYLKKLPNLEYLGIISDKVTPEGIAFLKTLPHIKLIDIGSTVANHSGKFSVIVNGEQRISYSEPTTGATP